VKYSDLVMEWLQDLGYTHCFFVAGGNSMHLLDGARQTMKCVPVVHEVAAGIAVEYFNEVAVARGTGERAFALVTAGPGLTNILTAMAGAYLESRELLVLGGQVKSTDLAGEGLRQRGIQEIDGVALTAPVSVAVSRIERPMGRAQLIELVQQGSHGRKGPVFLEFCLDAQATPVDRTSLETGRVNRTDPLRAAQVTAAAAVPEILEWLQAAHRPVVLLGGGVSREAAAKALPALREAALPVMTTWNGTDRIGADDRVFAGRPNTWGQRSANVLLQQCDLLIALGTRLGMQQTGFNWQAFTPLGRVVQVDVDAAELRKGHPVIDLPVCGDADTVLSGLVAQPLVGWPDWLDFCHTVRRELPVVEANETGAGYLDPYALVAALAERCAADDVIVPCSSGGAFTVAMQVFAQQAGQTIVTDKGLASMGYGLSGAIGAALAVPGTRTVLMEGDGGFTQNLQELATVAVNELPVKVFLFSNEGYASIRMTQRNYFGGSYLGCDVRTGLGFPDWSLLFQAYGIPLLTLDHGGLDTEGFSELFDAPGPAGFVVPVDPEQTYFPKISSRVTETGGMESAPLHLMSPDLPQGVASRVLVHLNPEGRA
jgi:acetolactate synthase-1/2/3 large subunit